MHTDMYLCGCSIEAMKNYRVEVVENGIGPYQVRGRTDSQGYDICPCHGERRYGWRSPMIQYEDGSLHLNVRALHPSKPLKVPVFVGETKLQRIERDAKLLMEERARAKSAQNGNSHVTQKVA